MQTEIKIKGIDKLQKKLSKVQAKEVFKEVFLWATDEIRGETSLYPPETAANIKKATGSWYQRGRGVVDATGKIYKRSENLSRKWYIKVLVSKLQVKIGNKASYAKFVHGDVQAKFHGERGWRKLPKVVKSYKRDIEKYLKQAVNRRLRR